MSETTKPVDTTPAATTSEAVGPVETAPIISEPTTVAETKPDVTTTEPAPVTTEPAVVEENKEEKAAKAVEPIYEGTLGYKSGEGFLKSLVFSKRHFWFGGEEPVSEKSLSHYLRGERPHVGNATAAWSSVTGKGLLYFAKKIELKKTPAGVINTSEVESVKKEGANDFSFMFHGHKHTFQAKSQAERDGWFLALERTAEEARVKKEEITGHQTYKDTHERLGKPAVFAAAGSAVAPKTEATTSTPVGTTTTEPAAAVTRTGTSSSSSSSDADGKKTKKSKSKSRSVSRNKRASIFGAFNTKKEKHDEKKEIKKAEHKAEEAAPAVTEPAVPFESIASETTAPAGTAAPLDAEAVAARIMDTPAEPIAPVEEAKPVTSIETPAVAPIETAHDTTKPKPTKRGSVFGSLFEKKVKSPTTEKKEHEILPAVPPKDETAPVVAEETPAVTEPVAETKPVDTLPVTTTSVSATTPKKEKGNFFGSFLKAKSPTSEHPPKLGEEPKKSTDIAHSEAPVLAPIEGTSETAPAVPEMTEAEVSAVTEPAVTEPAITEPAVAEPVKTEAPKVQTPATEKRKSSFFGFGGKKAEGEVSPSGEKKSSGFGGLFRNPSKAIRVNKEGKKEKEAAHVPAKVDETAEPVTEAPAVTEQTVTESAPVVEEPKTNGTNTIGDVNADSISVGKAPEAAPAVRASA